VEPHDLVTVFPYELVHAPREALRTAAGIAGHTGLEATARDTAERCFRSVSTTVITTSIATRADVQLRRENARAGDDVGPVLRTIRSVAPLNVETASGSRSRACSSLLAERD